LIAHEGGINDAGNLLSILWLGQQLARCHVVGIAAIFAGLTISGKSGPPRLRPEPVSSLRCARRFEFPAI
jgi:hypothetical protein